MTVKKTVFISVLLLLAVYLIIEHNKDHVFTIYTENEFKIYKIPNEKVTFTTTGRCLRAGYVRFKYNYDKILSEKIKN